MKKIAFAQNQEDVLLNRLFPGRSDGFYIDVGAFHPVFHSVTKFFYDRGWHGINIEPIPTMFETLARDRVRDVNLPLGLSNREGTLLFHEVPKVEGFSTFSTERAEELRRKGYALIEHHIPVTILARVCEQHAAPTIDFLKIDVEGHEREVVEGADWSRFRPRVVLIEATRPDTSIPSHEDWEALLLAADYLFASFDGLNRFYVRVEDRELLPLLSVPANVLDGFIPFEYHDRIQHLQRQVQEFQRQAQEFQRQLEEIRDSRERNRAALLEATQADLEATRGPGGISASTRVNQGRSRRDEG